MIKRWGFGGETTLWSRMVWGATLTAFLMFSSGCTSWNVKPILEVQSQGHKMVDKQTRFYLADGGMVTMHVTEVDFPFVRGVQPGKVATGSVGYDDVLNEQEISTTQQAEANLPTVEVDCRDVVRIEIKEPNKAATVVMVLAAATAFVVLAASMDSGGSSYTPPPSSGGSSQSSCPVLYVQTEGDDLRVGEPYAGAAIKCLQRQDMLPLPQLEGPAARLLLTNEARETQYTDFLELVLADHQSGQRAVATHEQKVILVGEPQAPLSAVDQAGEPALEQVTKADGMPWQTDLDCYVGHDNPPFSESLELAFAPALPGSQPVLEMTVANTYWLDMVMNRFLSLLGPRFDEGMARAGRPEKAPEIQEWMVREGIDLTVECRQGNDWRTVGTVHSVGPLSLRQVAVPLPADLAAESDRPLGVRLRGGLGFWQIDQVALSQLADAEPKVQSVAPVAVVYQDGRDQLSLVSQVDGQYQILPEMDTYCSLDFALPELEPGLARSAFFHSHGYYQAHRPLQGQLALGTMKNIMDEEGALSRFSMEIFQAYHEIALQTPRRATGTDGSH